MSSVTELINSNFGGIRRSNSSFSSEKITCSDCQNVELYYTNMNSGVGLRTVKGNRSVSSRANEGVLTELLPEHANIVGMFQSIQNGKTYFFVYAELNGSGTLYSFDHVQFTLTTIISGLKATGTASGCDFQQGWLDFFVFSNGEEIKYIYSNTETHEALVVESAGNIKLTDVDGRDVKGLGLAVFDDRIWVFNDKVLWYSQKADCRVFNYVDPSILTSSGYIEFVKNITAIYPYLGSLAVFHKDSSALVKLDTTTGFIVSDESPGGCASYNALVFHGTDLFFYDDTKKGVFSFQQVVNGDKTLGTNIAYDIQDELIKIKPSQLNEIKALSVVTDDRNEAWFLIPISETENHSIVMIYDYIRGEWIKRKCQKINTIAVINNVLYSAGKTIYEEYSGDDFNGEFIESYYNCSVLNLGKDNTLKITKFPPRVAVDASYKNNFFVKYVKNYNHLKDPKIKEIKTKSLKNVMIYDSDCVYDDVYIYQPRSITVIAKLPSATFKALEISFYTQFEQQSFCIKSLEMSKIKVKQV